MTREEEDIKFISNPSQWPMFPLLPVKNIKEKESGGFSKIGFIVASDKTHVIEGNVMAMPQSRAEFNLLPKHRYDSVEALVEAGWVVD